MFNCHSHSSSDSYLPLAADNCLRILFISFSSLFLLTDISHSVFLKTFLFAAIGHSGRWRSYLGTYWPHHLSRLKVQIVLPLLLSAFRYASAEFHHLSSQQQSAAYQQSTLFHGSCLQPFPRLIQQSSLSFGLASSSLSGHRRCSHRQIRARSCSQPEEWPTR